MQFTAVTLLSLMTLVLVMLLPRRVAEDVVSNRSRWLMVAGLGLLAVQFLLQHVWHFRAMGITQAVMVNLVFFIPCSSLLSLSVLNLQRQGLVRRSEWLIAIPTWLLSMGIIAWGAITDGEPLLASSERLLWSEVAASGVYAAMQIFYTVRQIHEVRRMQLALDSYYDHERGGLLDWMRLSIVLLSALALTVPLLIFASGWLLAVYGLVFFVSIFYLWFCFVRYVMSQAAVRMREAEQSVKEEEQEMEALKGSKTETGMSGETLQRVSQAVERWVAAGGYLRSGITSPDAAHEMQVPRYQLTAWVKASGHASFTRWMTTLRIEEAKRTLKEHPDWTNEAVADHCGFSRTYFQRTFKSETGLSPAEFVGSAMGGR